MLAGTFYGSDDNVQSGANDGMVLVSPVKADATGPKCHLGFRFVRTERTMSHDTEREKAADPYDLKRSLREFWAHIRQKDAFRSRHEIGSQ